MPLFDRIFVRHSRPNVVSEKRAEVDPSFWSSRQLCSALSEHCLQSVLLGFNTPQTFGDELYALATACLDCIHEPRGAFVEFRQLSHCFVDSRTCKPQRFGFLELTKLQRCQPRKSVIDDGCFTDGSAVTFARNLTKTVVAGIASLPRGFALHLLPTLAIEEARQNVSLNPAYAWYPGTIVQSDMHFPPELIGDDAGEVVEYGIAECFQRAFDHLFGLPLS